MDSNSLNSFIESRLQDNFSNLQSNADYIALNNSFNVKYKHLMDILPSQDLRLLENIIDMKSCLLSEEVYLSYKIGFSDGMNFNKEIK